VLIFYIPFAILLRSFKQAARTKFVAFMAASSAIKTALSNSIKQEHLRPKIKTSGTR